MKAFVVQFLNSHQPRRQAATTGKLQKNVRFDIRFSIHEKLNRLDYQQVLASLHQAARPSSSLCSEPQVSGILCIPVDIISQVYKHQQIAAVIQLCIVIGGTS